MENFDETQETTSQEELQNENALVVQEPSAPLTMEQAGGADNLYERYRAGEIVEFPPWLVETGNGNVEIITQELTIYITETQPILSVKLGNSRGIALFFYSKGRYVPLTDSDVKAFIKSFLPRRIRRSKHWEEVFRELKSDYANTDESLLNSQENLINFTNGVLDLNTGKLLPHSPDYLMTIQIPCDYKPNLMLASSKVALKFFTDFTGRNVDDMATVLEVLGLVISNVRGSRFKKLLIIIGPGNTGKSVLREFAIRLVGIENCHTIDMNQLNSKFGLGGIYGKRLVRFAVTYRKLVSLKLIKSRN